MTRLVLVLYKLFGIIVRAEEQLWHVSHRYD